MDLSFWNIVINTHTWIKMNWSVPVPGLSPNAHNTCCRSYNVIIITTIKQHMLLTLCLLISVLLGPVETIITSGSNKVCVCVCVSICAQRLLRFKFFIKLYLLWHGFSSGRSLCSWSSIHCQLQEPLKVLGISPVLSVFFCHDVYRWREKRQISARQGRLDFRVGIQ